MVAAGKEADLLVLDGDPLQDISNTEKIAAVMHHGVVVRPEKSVVRKK
jgi:imidazolonepropionase-like amidohydrolase